MGRGGAGDGLGVAARQEGQVRHRAPCQRQRMLGVFRQLDTFFLLGSLLRRDRAVATLIALLQRGQPLEGAAHLIAPARRAALLVIIPFAPGFPAQHMLRRDREVASVQDVLIGVRHGGNRPAATAQEHDIRHQQRPWKQALSFLSFRRQAERAHEVRTKQDALAQRAKRGAGAGHKA